MPYKRLTLVIIVLGVFLTPLYAQGKISGLVFGDYYYVLTSHDASYKGQNGFWIRRIYLTYDYEISEKFSTRLRFEMNSPDFTESSKPIIPIVKDAYLEWKLKGNSILLGISPTPMAGPVESFWGYRAVEKTAVDLQKFASSREFGLAVKGYINSFGYHLMVGNGEGEKSEYNTSKRLLAGVHLEPSHFLLQACGNWHLVEGYNDTYTYMFFGGYKDTKFKIGTQYAVQVKQIEPNTQMSSELVSSFLIYDFGEKLSLILRYDKMFDPSPMGISYTPFAQAKSNLIIGGIDLKPHEKVHFIPNVEYVFYDDTKTNSDLYLRLTFNFVF